MNSSINSVTKYFSPQEEGPVANALLEVGKYGRIRVGIIGGAGYTGGELIRLLINHPHATIAFVHSNSNAGNAISKVHADLIGETDIRFSGNEALDAESLLITDVLFLCTGHGEAKKFLEANAIPAHIKIIDLSNDFRLAKHAEFHQPTEGHHTFIRDFIYGLPELNKEIIRTAHNIANPGCFATAIQLGLLPLAKAGLLNDIYTTGITGSTGAGQGLSSTSHFSWRANNIQAYKTLNHQHMGEIVQSLSQLQSGFLSNPSSNDGLSFVPWRGDFGRLNSGEGLEKCSQFCFIIYNIAANFYNVEFIHYLQGTS